MFRNTWNIERQIPGYGWLCICASGENGASIAWDKLKPDAIKHANFRLTRPDGEVVRISDAEVPEC